MPLLQHHYCCNVEPTCTAHNAMDTGDVLEMDTGDVLEMDTGDVLEMYTGDVLKGDVLQMYTGDVLKIVTGKYSQMVLIESLSASRSIKQNIGHKRPW